MQLDLQGGPTSHCNQHRDEPLKMFCTDCSRAICFLCYAEHHVGHHCQVLTLTLTYDLDLDL